MLNLKKISIIVPCFNEALNLDNFYQAITEQIQLINSQNTPVNYELIFVNDGSTDNTLAVLQRLQSQDSQIKILDFTRNFGKEAGILAGLRASSGDLVTLIDADLQHPVNLIPVMYERLQNPNLDFVYARRHGRTGDSKLSSTLKPYFYKVFEALTNLDLHDGDTDFSMMKKPVINSILQLSEYHRFSKGIFQWIGFNKDCIEYENIARENGTTSWGAYKLFKYALDGILSFSATPLRVSFILGLISSLFAIIYGGYVLINTLIFGNIVKGYSSIVCLISFFGGMQLIVMGIIGEYIARIYEQSKHRPHYILRHYQDQSDQLDQSISSHDQNN